MPDEELLTPTDDLADLMAGLQDLARAQKKLAGAVLRHCPDVPRAGLAVLALLARCGPQPVGDLATRLHVDMSVVSRQLNALEDADLLTRTFDAHDRRVRVVALTPTGQELADKVHTALVSAAAQAFCSWSTPDLAAAAANITKVAAALAAVTA